MWPPLYPQPPPPTLNEGDDQGLPGEVLTLLLQENYFHGVGEGQLLLVIYQTREVALLRESLWNLEIGCAEDYDLLQENIEDVSGLRINTCF